MTRDYDFIGFTFGGKHSIDDFGVYRTSDGSRYNLELLPTLTEKTADVPGGDGQYYFYTNYKNRNFSISIAFDSLTEEKYNELKKWLDGKEIQELIFDETPYKVYSAKVTGRPSIKTICFLENGQRIYKGEGSIQFVCYYPCAHTPKETISGGDGRSLESYLIEDYPTREEWRLASNLPEQHEPGNNFGDLPTFFVLKSSMSFNPGTIVRVGDLMITTQTRCAVLEWDSRSGLVFGTTNNTKPQPVNGKSYGTIPVGGIDKETIYIIYTDSSGKKVQAFVDGSRRVEDRYEEPTTPIFTLEYNYWYY